MLRDDAVLSTGPISFQALAAGAPVGVPILSPVGLVLFALSLALAGLTIRARRQARG